MTRQEDHPACHNGVVRCWHGFMYWHQSAMICIWSSWCHCHSIISCFIKIQTDLIFLVSAYPGCPGKRAVKWLSVYYDTSLQRSYILAHMDDTILFCESFEVFHLFINGAFQVQVHAIIIVSTIVSAQLQCTVLKLPINVTLHTSVTIHHIKIYAIKLVFNNIDIKFKKPRKGANGHCRQHARLVPAYLQSQSQASSLGQHGDKMQWILVTSACRKLRYHVTPAGENAEIWLWKAVH